MEEQNQSEQPAKTMKDMGVPKEKIEGYLACNSSFTSSGPEIGNGMTQEEVTKWWNAQKAMLVNQIVFDLRKCDLLEGNEFMTEVSYIIHRQLVSTNWLAKCGWRAMWRAMLRKARAKAFQGLQARNVVPIGVAAQQANFELTLKEAMEKIKRKAIS